MQKRSGGGWWKGLGLSVNQGTATKLYQESLYSWLSRAWSLKSQFYLPIPSLKQEELLINFDLWVYVLLKFSVVTKWEVQWSPYTAYHSIMRLSGGKTFMQLSWSSLLVLFLLERRANCDCSGLGTGHVALSRSVSVWEFCTVECVFICVRPACTELNIKIPIFLMVCWTRGQLIRSLISDFWLLGHSACEH